MGSVELVDVVKILVEMERERHQAAVKYFSSLIPSSEKDAQDLSTAPTASPPDGIGKDDIPANDWYNPKRFSAFSVRQPVSLYGEVLTADRIEEGSVLSNCLIMPKGGVLSLGSSEEGSRPPGKVLQFIPERSLSELYRVPEALPSGVVIKDSILANTELSVGPGGHVSLVNCAALSNRLNGAFIAAEGASIEVEGLLAVGFSRFGMPSCVCRFSGKKSKASFSRCLSYGYGRPFVNPPSDSLSEEQCVWEPEEGDILEATGFGWTFEEYKSLLLGCESREEFSQVSPKAQIGILRKCYRLVVAEELRQLHSAGQFEESVRHDGAFND